MIDIGAGIPSRYAIDANAEALARYATLCQEAGIVPIVEPEVLMDGAHTLERCEEVTNTVLDSVFAHLFAARVFLEGNGAQAEHGGGGQEIRQEGLPRTGRRGHGAHAQAPGAVRGSGHRLPVGRPEPGRGDLAFEPDERGGNPAMGRSRSAMGGHCRRDALNAWGGKSAGYSGGQKALFLRAKLNGLAATGAYQGAMETSAA